MYCFSKPNGGFKENTGFIFSQKFSRILPSIVSNREETIRNFVQVSLGLLGLKQMATNALGICHDIQQEHLQGLTIYLQFLELK